MLKSTRVKLHSCIPCKEAKAFGFSMEREAMILGIGYTSQSMIGHWYTVVVAVIYLGLAVRPSVKAAKQVKAEALAQTQS
jgi:hypothetical protein